MRVGTNRIEGWHRPSMTFPTEPRLCGSAALRESCSALVVEYGRARFYFQGRLPERRSWWRRLWLMAQEQMGQASKSWLRAGQCPRPK